MDNHSVPLTTQSFPAGHIHNEESLLASFEARWKGADRNCSAPSIEAYLAGVSDDERLYWFGQLLSVEVACRMVRGEKPCAAEYGPRFPAWSAIIQDVFQELQQFTPSPGSDEATRSRSCPPSALSAAAERADPATLSRGREERQAVPANEMPTVPGYEIFGILGRGGMGVVYRARQLALNRHVALKMLRDGALAGPESLERFQTEAQTVARLRHPNVIQIYEIGACEGRPFFTLELAEGGSLAQKLKDQPQPPRQGAQLVETLARAMEAAHRLGIVHRDLKPSNVLLTADGVPKISDFGLAKQLEKTSAHTHSGALLGTPSYMAPEQARGSPREIGPATDVYALGAILYELLTGRPPFKAASTVDTVFQVLHQEPIPPYRLQPKTPRDLETICLKCLHKQPRQRYASAGGLAADLQRFLRQQPIEARPVGWMERGLKWARRQPAAAALVALCAMGMIGLWIAVLLVNAHLQRRVDEVTRIVEQKAHEEAEQQAQETRRQEIKRLRLNAANAAEKNHWEQAADYFQRALDEASSAPLLEDLQQELVKLLEVAQHRVEQTKIETHKNKQLEDFSRLYDQALFHWTFSVGGLPGDAEVTQQAAQKALSLFGLETGKEERLTFGPGFSAGERQRVQEHCYELLLVLADVVGRDAANQDAPNPAPAIQRSLALLDQAARLHPPTQSYYRRRAFYLRLSSDEPGARQAENVAAAQKPSDWLDYFLSGYSAYREKNPQAAIADFRAVLDRRPNHFWAQYLLAICHLNDDPEAALAYLDACLRTEHQSEWVYLVRGLAHGARGDYLQAEGDFALAMDLHPKAWACYALFVNRGSIRVKNRQHQGAVDDLKEAIRLEPRQVPGYFNLAKALIAWADAALEAGQEDLAAELACLGAVQLPGFSATLTGARSITLAQRRLGEAAQWLDQALVLKTDVPALYRLRAEVYARAGNWQAAQQALKRTIELDRRAPGEPLVADCVERGLLLHQLNSLEEARTCCDEACKESSSSASTCRRRAELLHLVAQDTADLDQRQKYYEKAADDLDRFLQSSASPGLAFYRFRAFVLAQLNDYAGAIADLSRALDLQADSGLFTIRGWAFLTLGLFERARDDFATALEVNAENPEARSGLGIAAVRLAGTKRELTEGLRQADLALAQKSKDTKVLYNAARVYALGASRLGSEPAFQARDSDERARQCLAQATRLLKIVMHRQPPSLRRSFWETIRADTALTIFRQTPEFKSWDDEFLAKGKNGR
jgi:tetratricopeptide (TPR) repeat protein